MSMASFTAPSPLLALSVLPARQTSHSRSHSPVVTSESLDSFRISVSSLQALSPSRRTSGISRREQSGRRNGLAQERKLSGKRALTGRAARGAIRADASAASDVAEDAELAAVEAAAWEILDDFNRRDVRNEPQVSLSTPSGVGALRASVLVAAEAALRDEASRPLLGICAGGVSEGFTALRQYLLAMGCADESLLSRPGGMLEGWEHKFSKEAIGPAFIKFNGNSKNCQVSPYQTGTFRGVILQLGRRQVGHLPLTLFTEV